jgi:hypothetical protein
MAWLENRIGVFVAPGTETHAQGARSYPIVTYTWALVRDRYGDPEKTAAVRRFLVWALYPLAGERRASGAGRGRVARALSRSGSPDRWERGDSHARAFGRPR